MNISQSQEFQLREITQRIVETVEPEMVFCFGCRTLQKTRWSLFSEGERTITPMQTAFDFLIIIENDHRHFDYAVTQMVEQLGEYPVEINCIAQRVNYVNEAIKGCSRFYYSVFHKGRILYNSGRAELVAYTAAPGLAAATEWSRWFDQSRRFFSLASHAYGSAWYGEAIFLFHQAVELACIAMLRFFTGYRANTHNLQRLLTLTETFSYAPRSVFPGVTREESEILNTINKAYSDSRYKEGYRIAPQTVEILRIRVKAFLSIAAALYKNGVNSLDDVLPVRVTDACEDPNELDNWHRF